MIVVLMGVAGVGKSAVGRRLASELGWRFFDADDAHAPEDVERMRAGVPLDEAARDRWIVRVERALRGFAERGEDAVVACSALRARHRERLRGVKFVHLVGRPELIARRLAERRGHFAGEALLPSQLAALEPPADVPEIDVERPLEEVVAAVRAILSI